MKEAALAMRGDVAALNDGVAQRLTAHGMAINKVQDTTAFRTALREAGFYAKWHETYGDAAWSALESTSGRLT